MEALDNEPISWPGFCVLNGVFRGTVRCQLTVTVLMGYGNDNFILTRNLYKIFRFWRTIFGCTFTLVPTVVSWNGYHGMGL